MRMSQRSSAGGRRRKLSALLTSIALGLATVIAAPVAGAIASAPSPNPTPNPAHHKLIDMGTFSPSSYAAQAARLPSGLTIALRRDVHLTAEQYLADGAAEARAVQVVAALHAAGVRVVGSKMDGARLTVDVGSTADVATVESTGATASLGAPKTRDFSKLKFDSAASTDTYGGEGYFFYSKKGQNSGNGSGDLCSIGFNGYSLSTGAPQFVTAGHCQTVIPNGNSVFIRDQSTSGVYTSGLSLGSALGTAVSGEGRYGGGEDYGIVSSGDAGVVAHNSIAMWGGTDGSTPSTSSPTTSTLAITGETDAMDNATLCKSGSTTGWTCGTIEAVDQTETVSGQTVNTIIATACLLAGDSGGGAVIGSFAVGIDSATDNVDYQTSSSSSCSDPVDQDGDPAVSAFFPMESAAGSNSVVGQQGTRWQLGVSVTTSTPTVTSPASGATVYSFSSMTGTLPGATSGSTALLYLDGSTTPFKKVSAASGTWTIPLSEMSVGTHTYKLAGGLGWSPGASVSGTITIAAANRIGGSDRYYVAVNLAQEEFPNPTSSIPVLFIADGLNYPDGLSAAPAAAHLGGTLLLTSPTSIPSEVSAEISQLKPLKIYVAGGTGSVSAAVFNQLVTMANGWGGTVTRDGGATRYQSSQSVALSAFPANNHIDKVFIANGGNFPDALSESGAAAKEGSPVILVPGTLSSLDSTTTNLFASYTPAEIVIAGGTASVSTGIQNQLIDLGYTVLRLGGVDRYQVSNLINTTFFSTTSNAYFANGGNFPDALGGGVLAAAMGAPLTVTPTACMEPYDVTALTNWGTTSVTLIGGTASLSNAVGDFTPCS
jgi:putative cell wall-binding protein